MDLVGVHGYGLSLIYLNKEQYLLRAISMTKSSFINEYER